MTRSFLSRFVVALVSLSATGCFFGSAPIPAPNLPLDPGEQRQVLSCQKRINTAVRQLQGVTTKQLSRCLGMGLDLVLDEERELTTATLPDFFDRRDRVRERCSDFFDVIGRASTRMIDDVIGKCAPVESLVLTDPSRGDPMGLKSFYNPISTVEELAAEYCGAATASAEVLVSSVYMRTADLAWRYYGTDEEEDLRSTWQASLDPRCARMSLNL